MKLRLSIFWLLLSTVVGLCQQPPLHFRLLSDMTSAVVPNVSFPTYAMLDGFTYRNDGMGGWFYAYTTNGTPLVANGTNIFRMTNAAGQSGNWIRLLFPGGGGTPPFGAVSGDLQGSLPAPTLVNPTNSTWFINYGDLLNVKWFGAVGDGVTDDTTAITNAIYRGENMTPVRGVYVPTGTFNTTKEIRISKQGMVFVGDNMRTSKIQYVGATAVDSVLKVDATGIYNVRVENLQLSGSANTTAALYITQAHHSSFRNLMVRNATYGLFVTFLIKAEFSNISCSVNEINPFTRIPVSGILLSNDVNDCTFINPIIEGVSGAGIVLKDDGTHPCIGNVFIGGTSEANGTGILLTGTSNGNKFMAPYLENNLAGIDLQIDSGAYKNTLFGSISGTSDIVIDGNRNKLDGGQYDSITISGVGNSLEEIDFANGLGSLTDVGTDTQITSPYNISTTSYVRSKQKFYQVNQMTAITDPATAAQHAWLLNRGNGETNKFGVGLDNTTAYVRTFNASILDILSAGAANITATSPYAVKLRGGDAGAGTQIITLYDGANAQQAEFTGNGNLRFIGAHTVSTSAGELGLTGASSILATGSAGNVTLYAVSPNNVVIRGGDAGSGTQIVKLMDGANAQQAEFTGTGNLRFIGAHNVSTSAGELSATGASSVLVTGSVGDVTLKALSSFSTVLQGGDAGNSTTITKWKDANAVDRLQVNGVGWIVGNGTNNVTLKSGDATSGTFNTVFRASDNSMLGFIRGNGSLVYPAANSVETLAGNLTLYAAGGANIRSKGGDSGSGTIIHDFVDSGNTSHLTVTGNGNLRFIGAHSLSTSAGALTVTGATALELASSSGDIRLTPAGGSVVHQIGDGTSATQNTIFKSAAGTTMTTLRGDGAIIFAGANAIETSAGGNLQLKASSPGGVVMRGGDGGGGTDIAVFENSAGSTVAHFTGTGNLRFIGAHSISSSAGDLTIAPGSGLLNVTGDVNVSGLTASKFVATSAAKTLVSRDIVVGDIGSGATLTAGAGMTGTTSGALLAAATLNIGAGTGITVNTDDVAVNTAADFSWSGTHTFGVRPVVSMTANPGYTIYDSDGTANNRRFWVYGNSGLFSIGAASDDDSTTETLFSVTTVAGLPTQTRLRGATINLFDLVGPGVLGINSSENITVLAPPGVNGYVLSSQTDGTLSWIAPSSGTVTSVALSLPTAVFDISGSPVTTSGTLTATFDTQTANTGFMGPTSGGAATPAFRAFVAADIPNLDAAKITTGTMATARLGSGSASSSTFLRGDSTWQAVGINNISSQVIGAGTDYTFSTSGVMEEVDFGTTDPTLSIAAGGTYLLFFTTITDEPQGTTTFIAQFKNTTDGTFAGVPYSFQWLSASATTLVTIPSAKTFKLFAQCSSTAPDAPKVLATSTTVGYVKLAD